MKLAEINISKEKWNTLTFDEQCFFVQLTHFMDEMSMLNKCSIYSFRGKAGTQSCETTARRVQALFFMRLLAGKLNEGWEMIGQSYFGTQISKEYNGLLSEDAKEALKRLKIYFNDSDCLARHLRKYHAFHYDRDAISESVRGIGEVEPFTMYVSEEQANYLAATSHTVVDDAILNFIAKKHPNDEPMTLLMTEISVDVYGWFVEFVNGVLHVIANKLQLEWKALELDDVPCLDDVDLPYFVMRHPTEKNGK